jgi:hypothetical protein
LETGKGLYVEGNDFGYDHAPGKYYYYGLYDYFGCTYDGDGVAYTPTGNIQTLTGQPGTWAFGMQEAYMYQQPPDHYPDYIGPNGGTIIFKCQQIKGRLVFHSGGTPTYRTIHSPFVFGAIKNAQSAATKQQLMAEYMAHLIGDAVPPAAPQQLAVGTWSTIQGQRLRLTWDPVTEDINGDPETIQHYTVHRATEAFFSPGAGNTIGQTANTYYIDMFDTIGDPATNYFYVVCAVDWVGNSSDGSAPAGEFDFSTQQ